MAIVTEDIGNGLTKTYSSAGFYIRGGMPESDYIEAVDPTESGREYTETEIPIISPDDEAQIEDYKEALRELGVEVE